MKKFMLASVLFTILIAVLGSKCETHSVPYTSIIFLSKATFTGNFGGISNADAICAAEATSAGLPGTYNAILSSASVDAVQRAPEAPFYTPTGLLIAASRSALFTSSPALLNTVSVYADGTSPSGDYTIWTGSLATGYRTSFHCNSWTDNTLTGVTGVGNATDYTWMYNSILTCSVARNIYCMKVFN